MNGNEVRTVPAATGTGWWNTVGGKVVSRHGLKDEAVAAGRVIAEQLQATHAIHEDGGDSEPEEPSDASDAIHRD